MLLQVYARWIQSATAARTGECWQERWTRVPGLSQSGRKDAKSLTGNGDWLRAIGLEPSKRGMTGTDRRSRPHWLPRGRNVDTQKRSSNMSDQAYTLREFARSHKIGKTKTYEEINAGRLQVYKVGTRTYVSTRPPRSGNVAWKKRCNASRCSEFAVARRSPTRGLTAHNYWGFAHGHGGHSGTSNARNAGPAPLAMVARAESGRSRG